MKKRTLFFLNIFSLATFFCYTMETSTDITPILFNYVYSDQKDSLYSQRKYNQYSCLLKDINTIFTFYQQIAEQPNSLHNNYLADNTFRRHLCNDLRTINEILSHVENRIREQNNIAYKKPFREYYIDTIIDNLTNNDESLRNHSLLPFPILLTQKYVNKIATFSLKRDTPLNASEDTHEWAKKALKRSNQELLKDDYLLELFKQREEKYAQFISLPLENKKNQQKGIIANQAHIEELKSIEELLQKCNQKSLQSSINVLNATINHMQENIDNPQQTEFIILLHKIIIKGFEDKKI